MKQNTHSNDIKTRFFGVFQVVTDRERQTARLRVNFARLLLVTGAAAFACYLLVVTGGYIWLREVRGVKQVNLWDVAFCRVSAVRHGIGEQQFAQASAAWKEGKYQAAYIAYLSGVRNAPGHAAGRIEAANFLVAAGVPNLAVITLQDGLRRNPQDTGLLSRTMELLTGSGRDREALRLLRDPLFKEAKGENLALLRRYEVLAVLNTEGPAAARTMLESRPDVRADAAAASAVARVLWSSGDKPGALQLLGAHVAGGTADFFSHGLLCDFQESEGLFAEAMATAERACAKFSDMPAARLLRIAALSHAKGPEGWRSEIERFVGDFKGQPQPMALLAELAGRRGWTMLSRGLYEAAVAREADARIPAMFYAEALFRSKRAEEALDVMRALERQSGEETNFMVLLRQRQIVVAAALGRMDEAREYARRLASSLGRDPERLEATRRRFAQSGLGEVAAELAGSAPKPRPTAKKTG